MQVRKRTLKQVKKTAASALTNRKAQSPPKPPLNTGEGRTPQKKALLKYVMDRAKA